MHETYATLMDYAAQRGWSDYALISILCEYIDNQKDPETFADFLDVKAHMEAGQRR